MTCVHSASACAERLCVAVRQLVKGYVSSRPATLQWIQTLLNKCPHDVMPSIEELFPLLLRILSDPSDEVVSLDLEVLARLSSKEDLFDRFVVTLLQMFSTDHKLLGKAGLIIRQLSLLVDTEKVFRAVAKRLEDEKVWRWPTA